MDDKIVRTVKELILKSKNDNQKLSIIVDKYIIPLELEQQKNGEYTTPFDIRQAILDAIDPLFWTTPKKVFEFCAGKGQFILDIIERFMIGLKPLIPDKEERYKTIVEECIYFAEINPMNAHICKLLMDPENKYNLNYYQGDTLELDVTQSDDKHWTGVEGFDAVIGNPPYGDPNGASNGTLWDKFTKLALQITVKDGLICLIHPGGWRNVDGKFKPLQKQMLEKNLIRLEIYNESAALSKFKAETRFDWYIMQNTPAYTTTRIKFQDNTELDVDVRLLEFIPNGQFDLVQQLWAKDGEEKCEVLYSRSSYGSDKNWVSEIKYHNRDGEEDSSFRHECVYTINSNSKLKFRYSNKEDGNGRLLPKLMWSNGRISSIGSVIDREGVYGLTNFAYGIVDSLDNLEHIKEAFDSKAFRKLMEYCAVGQNSVNFKAIAQFKKDFWKEFIVDSPEYQLNAEM